MAGAPYLAVLGEMWEINGVYSAGISDCFGVSRREPLISHISQKAARYPDFLYAALPSVACAAFCKESRMKFIKATELHRKSGGMGHPNRWLG
jgi:hypothetical protein